MVVSPNRTENPNKPRIISEVRKSSLSRMKSGLTAYLQDIGRAKISGYLIWNASTTEKYLRMAEVRQGSLILFNQDSSGAEFRLPLRQLNLQPCNAPRTFRLTQCQETTQLTFQALTDEEYEKWVKVLAVELIRQTPLQDVRFLDIISITRNRQPEETGMRRGRSEECLVAMKDTMWDNPVQHGQEGVCDFSRDRRYRSLTFETDMWEEDMERRHKAPRNKYNFKDDIHRGKKSNTMPAEGNADVRQAIMWRIRPGVDDSGQKTTWARTQSEENLKNLGRGTVSKGVEEVSDESGISSGDENNNTIIDTSIKNQIQEGESYTFVSVREKKKFFESLSTEADGCTTPPAPSKVLTRSNSIGDLKMFSQDTNQLRPRKRTRSLYDLSRTGAPVKEICRLFERKEDCGVIEEEKDGTVREEAGEPQVVVERNAMFLLHQRRLKRGERKLSKLRTQISEVEETIKVIADDLSSIASCTLKRREGADVFAALQRRLAEENSRLERLQEETTRVVKDNQRTIMKLKALEEK